ncbi:MAG: helicase HerA-like domain-containing protein [Candidatus Odinarchaeia archaeon]
MSKSNILGRCIGEAATTHVEFISKKMPKVGEYVTLEYEGQKVLGMIEDLLRGSVALNTEIYDPQIVEKIKSIEGEDYYIRGVVKILGDTKTLKMPRTPPPPGTEVIRADRDTLESIFNSAKNGLRIGTLITHEDVPASIDVNLMVTRHLAILAMTGAGKSNTVAVIVDGLLKLNGCIIIFDMHSEYTDAEFKNGEVKKILPKINPLNLSFGEFSKLARISQEKAHVQERYLRMAMKEVKKDIEKNTISKTEFFNGIEKKLREYMNEEKHPEYKPDKKSIIAVINKIEELKERYETILDVNISKIINQIELGKVNVIDLGTIDEDATDVIVSHITRDILESRKTYVKKEGKGLKFPVFIIVEEAHIIAPNNRITYSRYWINRIAREGRKFGVGLCLVSQSPKSLDSEALSQANNMIILRLVEPTDQRHVQTSSESLSEDLLNQLPSLNIGEAVVVGLMTKVPALVKIDKFEGKFRGADPNIVQQWNKIYKEEIDNAKKRKKEIEDILGD